MGISSSYGCPLACARCKGSVVPAELGGARVEICRVDRGIFLDQHELVAVNGGKTVTASPPRSAGKVQDDVGAWLQSLGV